MISVKFRFDCIGRVNRLSTKVMGRGDDIITSQRAEMLRVSMQRAVGGVQTILREFSRISFEIDGKVQVDWMLKRVQFYAFELTAKVQNLSGFEAATIDKKIETLNRFFFHEKGFRIQTEENLSSWNNWLFQNTLADRAGAAEPIGILYATLAAKIGINLEVVSARKQASTDPANLFHQSLIFKFLDDLGQARYLDIIQNGKLLRSEDILKLCHCTHEELALLFESVSVESFIAAYVTNLKRLMRSSAAPERLLYLQNLLIAWRPSDLRLLVERAFLHRRLGQLSSAMADLKRYFTFHNRDEAPAEVVDLMTDVEKQLKAQLPPQPQITPPLSPMDPLI
jgi:regulator of sirC expression with transglutaminase-like and TPR domain